MTSPRPYPRRGTAYRDVLDFVFRFRRLINSSDPCAQQPCEQCYAPHVSKLMAYIDSGAPIHFVIPAFPAKSPNLRKVVGALPDLAERLALDFIQSFCDNLSHFHPPGARVTICSDGHVFSDLVGVADDQVSRYRDELQHIITKSGWDAIDRYQLDDAFGEHDFAELRRLLDSGYATPLEDLRERTRHDLTHRALFNGIHRFIFEDMLTLRPLASRSRIRRDSKEIAYQTIRRSNAWSALVAERFPGALRLSIHPQPVHAEKIGFQLLPTHDGWLTPWHGVALHTGKQVVLVKREEAERLNASLILRGARPSHFVAPHVEARN